MTEPSIADQITTLLNTKPPANDEPKRRGRPTAGASGSSGPTGASGFSGASGTSGATGASGSDRDEEERGAVGNGGDRFAPTQWDKGEDVPAQYDYEKDDSEKDDSEDKA